MAEAGTLTREHEWAKQAIRGLQGFGTLAENGWKKLRPMPGVGSFKA